MKENSDELFFQIGIGAFSLRFAFAPIPQLRVFAFANTLRGGINMDRKILEDAGIDFEDGLTRCLNDTSLYERVLGKFPNDQNYSKLVEAMDAGDVKEAFEAAHTLKGVSANLGLKALYDSVFVLVESLRNASDTENAKPLLPPVSSNYNRVIEALKNSQ